MEHYDVVFLGGGSGAETAAPILARAGRSVAVVEERLLGGECPYFACIPSKAMLHKAAEFTLLREHGSGPDAAAAWRDAISWRDSRAVMRSDAELAQQFAEAGIAVFRGRGCITGPGRVEAAGEEAGYQDLVLNCGSKPTIPEIAGLENLPFWTSDAALSSKELPESLLILGGSAVACELAQIYARFGCKVTVLQRGARLMSREEPRIGEILQERLQSDGVNVKTNVHIERADKTDGGVRLHAGNEKFEAEKVLVATGRHPDLRQIGLESLGISGFEKGVRVDETLRVKGAAHVWAIGDCNGIAPYTHTANYQARIAAANILGGNETADHRAIPRGTYTDPSIAAVGMTKKSAEKADVKLVTAEMELNQTARAFTDGIGSGWAWLAADAETGKLAGAALIGPHAEEMISEMTLAIKAGIPVRQLAGTVHPFPSLSEVWEPPLRELSERLG